MEVSVLQSKGNYVVKKYEDRKMYDMQRSKVVSLLDIEKLVLEGKSVMVISKNDEDITTEILIDAFGKGIKRMKSFGKISSRYVKELDQTMIKLMKEFL